MSSSLAAVPAEPDPMLDRLRDAVRAGLAGEIIRIDPDDPVFARGRCRVAGHSRGGWSRMLCSANYNRWRRYGSVNLDVFAASTGPVQVKATSRWIDVFDLSALPTQLRLEVAYSIQRRHDDRTVRLVPTMISRLVALLSVSGIGRCWTVPWSNGWCAPHSSGAQLSAAEPLGSCAMPGSTCMTLPTEVAPRPSSPAISGEPACSG